ncbi:hypothetical protein GLT92_00615 [Nanohaloarchaea archaeon]|mgnify:FL=1|nr:hypothetical protein [Candidatus Nanohaloarchaea archaeon]
MVEEVFFATGNKGKIKEMRPFFEDREIELRQIDVDVPEIDAMDVERVAERKVRDSFEKALSQDLVDEDDLLIVEDTGFYVEALNGFPGPEAAFFSRTVGVDRLPALMNSVDDRSAYFKTAIAAKKQNQLKVFTGKLEGKVPEKPQGDSHDHLPYNSYFIPDGRESSLAEKSMHSDENFHRTEAAISFLENYIGASPR